eukprot:5379964-Pyramimonas_sp.AAC.1
MFGFQNDPHTPCNLKCPDPAPAQEVEFPAVSTVLMMQDTYHAGTPAGGSDGSWIQARNADATGSTSSGTAPSDTLCVNDPWRAHGQHLPVPAGHPASFAPMSRATTPFGIHRVLGVLTAYRRGSKTFEWTRSSARFDRRHRHLHRHVHMRVNLLFLTNMRHREPRVRLVSKYGCIGRCAKPLRVCVGKALTSLAPTGRRLGSTFRIQTDHRTTPVGLYSGPKRRGSVQTEVSQSA